MMHIRPGEDYNLPQWRHHERYPDALLEILRHSRSSYGVETTEPWDPQGMGFSNTLWLDGHVSAIRQTRGEDILPRWYTGGVGNWLGNSAAGAIGKRY